MTDTTESERITVWERVRFKDSEPISWERSMDKGKTWESIHWPFGKLPFVLAHRDNNVIEVAQVSLEMP